MITTLGYMHRSRTTVSEGSESGLIRINFERLIEAIPSFAYTAGRKKKRSVLKVAIPITLKQWFPKYGLKTSDISKELGRNANSQALQLTDKTDLETLGVGHHNLFSQIL